MLRRGEVGCRALNDHGNYIVDHGKNMEKSWNFVFEFLWEPCVEVYQNSLDINRFVTCFNCLSQSLFFNSANASEGRSYFHFLLASLGMRFSCFSLS